MLRAAEILDWTGDVRSAYRLEITWDDNMEVPKVFYFDQDGILVRYDLPCEDFSSDCETYSMNWDVRGGLASFGFGLPGLWTEGKLRFWHRDTFEEITVPRLKKTYEIPRLEQDYPGGIFLAQGKYSFEDGLFVPSLVKLEESGREYRLTAFQSETSEPVDRWPGRQAAYASESWPKDRLFLGSQRPLWDDFNSASNRLSGLRQQEGAFDAAIQDGCLVGYAQGTKPAASGPLPISQGGPQFSFYTQGERATQWTSTETRDVFGQSTYANPQQEPFDWRRECDEIGRQPPLQVSASQFLAAAAKTGPNEFVRFGATFEGAATARPQAGLMRYTVFWEAREHEQGQPIDFIRLHRIEIDGHLGLLRVVQVSPEKVESFRFDL